MLREIVLHFQARYPPRYGDIRHRKLSARYYLYLFTVCVVIGIHQTHQCPSSKFTVALRMTPLNMYFHLVITHRMAKLRSLFKVTFRHNRRVASTYETENAQEWSALSLMKLDTGSIRTKWTLSRPQTTKEDKINWRLNSRDGVTLAVTNIRVTRGE